VGGCAVDVVSMRPVKNVAAIALGSNLGDREAMLRVAVTQVEKLGRVVAVSSFFDTAPVGYTDQPRFLNGALLLETELTADVLMRGLLDIERAMGRERVVAKGPRVVDLDLLLFGDAVMEQEGLVVPHPGMTQRRFVLEPLAEIAEGMVHPVSGKTVGELLAGLDV
jgi:2-amino-4-hydroxy-6-hydroxymethyldihydropteridine diphosphokinase